MGIAIDSPGRPPRTGRCPAALAAGILALAGACDRPAPAEAPTPSEPPPAMPAFVPKTPPLRPGDPLPALVAAGWLNGPAPSPSAPGVRLLVVDLWANWCPLCRQGAPELLGLHKKFATRGVAFVSLTNMNRESVTQFVNDFGLSWPNGYEASGETLAALGAGTGNPMPGYGVAPTLYLVGPDGKVVWADGQARYAHVESRRWRQDVEQAIEAALAKDPTPAR